MKDKTKLFKNFISRNNGINTLELIIPGHCDVGCVYCYIDKNNNIKHHYSNLEILNSIDKILSTFQDIGFAKNITLFGKEDVNLRILILEHLLNKKIDTVLIPIGEKIFENIENIERFKEIQKEYVNLGKKLHFSISMDGKYMENNKPNIVRESNYYENIFTFAKQTGSGFHPMIYSNGIEKWWDNFLWFDDNLKKYDMNLDRLYLLEVRNPEWSNTQIKIYGGFLKKVIEYTLYNSHDKNEWYENYIKKMRLNIFSIFSKVPKGMSCGLPVTLSIRLGDLEIYPCHRLQKDIFRTGNITNDIFNIDGNFETFMYSKIFNFKNQPYCSNCRIKEFCPGQCLGACWENSGNIFLPIPQVCKLLHQKVYTTIKTLSDNNVLDLVKDINKIKINELLEDIENVRKNY